MISQQMLKTMIDEIQKEILTSSNIVNRSQYPYYYNHPNIPHSLISFKKRLSNYRQACAELIAKENELPLPNAPKSYRNFAVGNFAHHFAVALAVAQFGIGDCGECSSMLGMSLIQEGFDNLAFVGCRFTEAKEGMEKYHFFVVANVPTLSFASNNSISIYDFLNNLPSDALIGDAFLRLVFAPSNIPVDFINYLNAYGGTTEVFQCTHFFNLPRKSQMFGGYHMVAEKTARQLKTMQPLCKEDSYILEDKTKINNTSLILLLRAQLPFFAVRDKDHKVDAVVELNSHVERTKALNLKRMLKSHGRFFNSANAKEIFVLEGINLPIENPILIGSIQRNCK